MTLRVCGASVFCKKIKNEFIFFHIYKELNIFDIVSDKKEAFRETKIYKQTIDDSRDHHGRGRNRHTGGCSRG